MMVLGIDTSTPRSSLAIVGPEGARGVISLVAPRGRHETVLPALEQLGSWTGVDLDQIDGIAVGTGPGLFTGMRVGIEVAKTLAQVLEVPIVGVSSLAALAFAVRTHGGAIAAVIDGRRGEVFMASYRSTDDGVERLTDPAVLTPEAASEQIHATGEDTLVVGNGATLYSQVFAGASMTMAPEDRAFPDAAAIAALAIPRFERGEHDALFDVVPTYLRKSDAEIAWDRKN